MYLVLFIYGLVIKHDSSADFVPVNDADNWLHLGLAVTMIALGVALGRRRDDTGQPVGTGGRTQERHTKWRGAVTVETTECADGRRADKRSLRRNMYLRTQQLMNEIVDDEPDPAAADALQRGPRRPVRVKCGR